MNKNSFPSLKLRSRNFNLKLASKNNNLVESNKIKNSAYRQSLNYIFRFGLNTFINDQT